ncbi:MAG: DUF2306 domain-containing protein [Ktedonobacteraceae bacterium]|nr:DUF2306 domain-containing protein [Ktedonobacteraceae bacterium]
MLQIKRKNIGWGSLILFIILMTGVTLLTTRAIFAEQKQLPLVSLVYVYYSFLAIHIVLATVAVLAGIIQFFPGIRSQHIQVHRISGRIYVWSVFVSGVTALFVALFTERFDEQVAFLTLDVLWLLSIWKAFRAIRQKKVAEHRLWMVRNYAITLAAVFARGIVPLMILLQFLKGPLPAGGFATLLSETLGTGVWLSIVLNLVLADWLVNRRQSLRSAIGKVGTPGEN